MFKLTQLLTSENRKTIRNLATYVYKGLYKNGVIIIMLYLYHLYYFHTPWHIIVFVLYCMLTGRWAYCWKKPKPIKVQF